jgi:hypothetical protein
VEYLTTGMTLRDHFATAAMEGILASCPSELEIVGILITGKAMWAEYCYKMADAMLKAREA